jgi:hypothetical protein
MARLGLFSLLKMLPGPRASFYSMPLGARRRPDLLRSDLTELLRLLEQGVLRPVIAEVLPPPR